MEESEIEKIEKNEKNVKNWSRDYFGCALVTEIIFTESK